MSDIWQQITLRQRITHQIAPNNPWVMAFFRRRFFVEGVAPKHFWGRSFSSAVAFFKKNNEMQMLMYIYHKPTSPKSWLEVEGFTGSPSKSISLKKVKQKVVWCWWAVGCGLCSPCEAGSNCWSVGMSCNLLYLLAFFRQYKYVGLGLCRYMIFSCKCMIFSAKSLIFPQDFHGKELSRALLGHLEDFPKGATAQPHDDSWVHKRTSNKSLAISLNNPICHA